MKRHGFAVVLSSLSLVASAAVAGTTPSCSLDYDLPADIPVATSDATPSTFQEFSWRSFLGVNAPSVGGAISTSGDNVPQWADWSATVDLLLCQGSPTPDGCLCASGGCSASGTRYYPSTCRAIPGYESYRVLGQVNKVDDSFEEAATNGLSGDPVIDRFGGFLRYEILLSPATYDEIIDQGLYDEQQTMARTTDINLVCGNSSYTGGDPANADMGAMVVKLAWMDVTDALDGGEIDASQYHVQQALVFTPGYRNSDGEDTCDLRTMALVGMHIAHKTVNQPNWIWSTFEHSQNAPDCTDEIPGPNSGVANTSCPDSVDDDYNFYGEACSGGAAACAACNAAPAENGDCQNPTTTVGAGYCPDEAPASSGGISQLCRQVPIDTYPNAAEWNTACQTALGAQSVWSNYSLISAQWGTSAFAAGCNNVASQISGSGFSGPVDSSVILPQIPAGSGSDMRPLLGNTSMESYDRSNCMGCHSKSSFTNNDGTVLSTDLIYFLKLQVSAPATSREAFRDDLFTLVPAGDEDDGCQVAAPRGDVHAWMLLIGALALALARNLRNRPRLAADRVASRA